MSSWTQQRKPVNAKQQPLQQSQQQPMLQPQQVGAVGTNVHGIPPHFGSQNAWPQNFAQQPVQPVQQTNPTNWAPNPIPNAYQQHNPAVPLPTQSAQHNTWPQQDFNPMAVPGPQQMDVPTSGYFSNQENFLQPLQQQQQPAVQQSFLPQQYLQNIQQPVEIPPPVIASSISYSRQSTQQMDNMPAAPEHFDNKQHNNNNDGWGDWDWNDNNYSQQQLQQQPPAPLITDTLQANANNIEDSFRTETNDNWQWGPSEEVHQQQNNLNHDDLHQNSQQPPPQEENDKIAAAPLANFKTAGGVVPPLQSKATTVQPALAGVQHPPVRSSPVVVKPTNLPLNEVSQSPEGAQNNNNIPSPVYVSQAKPVSKPPRQYAILPGASNDIATTSGPTTPPHAFQNRTEPQPPSTVTAGPLPISAALPPPISSSTKSFSAGNNPFKRAGSAQHHRAVTNTTISNTEQPKVIMPPLQNYASPPPPPPEEFANPSTENREVIGPDNSEVLQDNQEVAPNNDRNEYLQTSHLSEMGGPADATFNIEMQEQNNESDDFPPPGLSRLVLGQPENELRHIPGTEVENNLNIERQADGEDTDPSQQRSTFAGSTDVPSNISSSQMDITADRNLYLVPGESDAHAQRVVTGLENGSPIAASVQSIQVEQRELELDGENIEDQQQPSAQLQSSQHHYSLHHHRPVSPVQTSRDEPLEGANSLDRQVQGSQHPNHETESNMTVETNVKDLSNISTGNDESDHRDRHYGKSRRGGDDNKKRRSGNESKEKRYETEESDYSSERERRRYREGSVRSDRDRERDSNDRKRRDKREREVGGDRERDRDRYRGDTRENRYRDKYYRDREEKHERGGRYGSGRYDVDSKYETEVSSRHERRRGGGDHGERGGDRGERGERVDREAYEEYRRYRKYNKRDERNIQERRGGGRVEIDRRRGDREYRDDREVRREKIRSDYEEYRKTNSRNARESDVEKELRLREKDPRYAASNMYSGYTGYGYDPYAAYYYEQMVRTNPQAYSEWYKKYYGHAQAPESVTNDGRESVHSGRSSANNEKDRYSSVHHQYIPHPIDYHRHFVQQTTEAANGSTSMNSTMIESQQQQGVYNLSRGPSTGNLSQLNQLSRSGYYPSTARSYYARSEYSESRTDNLSRNLADANSSSVQQDPERLTPYKFTIDHPIVSLAPGLMIAVKPKYSQNGIPNVVKIFKMGVNDAANKLFQSYPGPLVRGITHKKTIIEFCEEQIRLGPRLISNRSRQNSINSLHETGRTNKPSFTLMWNLLILLLRQNGMVVGTDIAELLIKNQQQFPYEIQQTSVAPSLVRSESLQSDEQRKSKDNTPIDTDHVLDDLITDTRDESDETSGTTSLTEIEITDKFRNYLLYGNVNEALEWAADNNLWGHALFLASKMDRRSHANVMMKFANKLSLNDPLQTLYQLMSGRTPSSVTSVQDEKWGDWRPHLSMILSNTSQKPELDRKAITTLGDSLLNRGDIFAAHFCYLMAQVGFSKYPDEQSDSVVMQNTVRLVLLGSSHQKPFEQFVTDESILMTEVYEYACSLNDEKFSLVEFQPYKFLLALKMLDYGYHLKCLMYMEQIFLHIQRDPSKYESAFINQVYELADRLKYYDPVLEKSIDEIQMDGSPSHSTEVPFEEQKWLQDFRSLATEYTVAHSVPKQDYQQTTNVIDQQFSEINRQFNELNLQYNNSGVVLQEQIPHQSQTESNEVQYQSKPESVNQILQPNDQQYPQMYDINETQHSQTVRADVLSYGNGYMQPQEAYQQPQQAYDPQQKTIYDQQTIDSYVSYGNDDQQTNSYEYWSNQGQLQNDEREDKSNSKSTSMSENSDSVSSTIKSAPHLIQDPQKGSQLNSSTNFTTKSTTDKIQSPMHTEKLKKHQEKQQLKSFNFKPIARHSKPNQDSINNSKPTSFISSSKQQQTYLTATDTARPTISMPNSLSQKSGLYENSRLDDAGTKSTDAKNAAQPASLGAGPKPEAKNQTKGGQSSNQNSGWFGGIWNKLSLKPKNQMILPDDKNPAIVWDAEKKKWVNTDGEEAVEENLKPPPKMSDLIPSPQGNISIAQQQHQTHHHEDIQQQIQQQVPQPIPSPGPMRTYNSISSNAALMPGEPVKTPNLQSNMFKMQRNRTLKNSYVDVFNPSGAAPKSSEQVLAPALPPPNVPAGGFFMPGASTSDGAYQQQSQPAQEGTPQFYNPNQYAGY